MLADNLNIVFLEDHIMRHIIYYIYTFNTSAIYYVFAILT